MSVPDNEKRNNLRQDMINCQVNCSQKYLTSPLQCKLLDGKAHNSIASTPPSIGMLWVKNISIY